MFEHELNELHELEIMAKITGENFKKAMFSFYKRSGIPLTEEINNTIESKAYQLDHQELARN